MFNNILTTIADFIKVHILELPLYMSVAFVLFFDSYIALVALSIMLHLCTVLMFVFIYVDNITPLQRALKPLDPVRAYVRISFETIILLLALGMRDHWYTFVVACIYIIAMFVSAFSGRKRGNS